MFFWRKICEKILDESSKIKNSENFLSRCVSDETIKNRTWFSAMPDRMMKIHLPSHPLLSLYLLHMHTKSRFGGFSLQQMRFKRNYKNMTYAGSNDENIFPLTHPSRSTVSTYTQNHDLVAFLLSKCVSDENIKNMTWFSIMSVRMAKIFFSLTHISRSTATTYTQNHDLVAFLLSKCVSNETIKIWHAFRLCRIKWWKYFFLSTTHLSTPSAYTQNHNLEDFLLRKCVSDETIKKSDVIFDYAGSNVETIFSSHPPLSL